MLGLGVSYKNLFAGITDLDGQLAAVPDFVTALPPRDMLVKTTAVASRAKGFSRGSVTIDLDATYSETEVESMLAQLDPALVSVLDEAKEAVAGQSKGRVRHVAVSLREVCTRVLHHLAPDKEVGQWTKDPAHYHRDKPTRRARILYINRSVNYGPYAKYLSRSIKASDAFFDTLQDATHNLEPDACDFQLRLMLRDAKNILEALLLTAKYKA